MPIFYDLEKEIERGNQLTYWQSLRASMPIYVTNKTNSGFVAELSQPIGLTLLIMFLGVINAIGWGIYGILELAEKIT